MNEIARAFQTDEVVLNSGPLRIVTGGSQGPIGPQGPTGSPGGVTSVAGLNGVVNAVDLRDATDVPIYVATRTALKALDATKDTVAYLTESGREGIFIWRAANFATQIAADTLEGLYVKATAIASNLGAWVRQRDDLTNNVRWFGSDGTITNDTAAFAAALVMLTTQGKLYAPAGTYTLSSGTLAKTLSAGQSITIGGDGLDATILYFPNNGDGIALTYTANSFAWLGGNNVIVEDLSFVTNVQNTGRAISVIGASTIGNPNRPTVFNRVGFRGTVNNSSYWTNGIYISDTQNVVVNDCYYYSYATGLLGTGIFYTGTTNAAHPTVLNVHNFNMQFGATGIQCTGYVEGLNVTQSNITQVANGVSFNSTVALPQCSVTATQIYASSAAITSNATASQITANIIFLSGGFAIVASGTYGTYTGNTFVGVSGTPNGIVLQSGATDSNISGNVFKGLATNIWLQAGANNNTVGINTHADGTPLLDQGTGNYTISSSTGKLTFNGAVLSSGAGGLGYATGAGGTVTQATSKATGVALNKVCGQITMNAASLAAAAIVSFTNTAAAVAATDTVIANHISGGTLGAYTVNGRAGAGSVSFDVRNNTAGALAEAIVIQYSVIKAVNA